MSKRIQALIRGGHKHPEQILADLEAGGCIVLDPQEADDYEAAIQMIEDGGVKDMSLRDYICYRSDKAYDAGFQRALDVANDRFRK